MFSNGSSQPHLPADPADNAPRPVVLFTNDDGIASPGLWATVEAFSQVCEPLVVAPRDQQSGTGRSLPRTSEGRIFAEERVIGGRTVKVYAVDGTPAQAVQHGVLELADRLPALVVSGINYGDNLGNGVTISGTVGAAIEAASLGIPALALSQSMSQDLHLSYSTDVDFVPAAQFSARVGVWMMSSRRPDDVDILKIDFPVDPTADTPWRTTRLSRRRVYWPTRPERLTLDEIGRLGYMYKADPSQAEPDSDVYAVLHERVISVTPMSLDMTSRTDPFRLEQMLRGRGEHGSVIPAEILRRVLKENE